MTTNPSQPDGLAQSFADHLRAFHAGLPPEEQQLLETIVALADAATQQGVDTQAFGAGQLPVQDFQLLRTTTYSIINAWPKKYTGTG
jgi:hypothetical protein